MHELEFTVEPFVEGEPGPHVRAAVEAAVAAGAEVEFGPFASTCRVGEDELPEVVAAITRAAFAHGATYLAVNVTRGSAGSS